MVWRDSLDLTTGVEGDVASPILALMNTGAILRSGLANPRWSYLPIDPGNQAAVQFARLSRARHVPELDIDGERVTECWILDSGPGGLLGGMLASVYSEVGPAAAAVRGACRDAATEPAPEPRAPASPPTTSATRCAASTSRSSSPPARSPAATRPDERAASVRAALEDAVEHAFGDGPEEQLLRDVLRRGYLDAQGSHEAAWWELHLSRATYFRKLRTASARVAEWLLSHPR